VLFSVCGDVEEEEDRQMQFYDPSRGGGATELGLYLRVGSIASGAIYPRVNV